jgi:6-phosphogluconolactonase
VAIKEQFFHLENFNNDIAHLITSLLIKESSNKVLISLGGGNTPRVYNKILVNLLSELKREGVLRNTFFTLTDERHVRLDEPSSNTQMILESFIKPLRLEQSFIFPEFYDDLEIFREKFEQKIDLFKGHKLLSLLGVGSDGHTASLYPGNYNDDESSVISVKEGHDGLSRISLSQRELLKYRNIWFLANSEPKLSAVKNSLSNNDRYEPIRDLTNCTTKIFY